MISDLQFSSEDEFDEVPFGGDDNVQTAMGEIELTEMKPLELPAEDDSQQAAEAMVQLSNIAYYDGEPSMMQQGNINNLSKSNFIQKFF